MAILRVDDFKAALKGGGARPNLFQATITFPVAANAGGDIGLTTFMCKAAQLPASVMSPIPVGFRGRQIQVAGDRVFEPWVVNIINDTDFTVRNSMERWMNSINAHSANTGLTNPASYQSDMYVDQLDKDGTVLKKYAFRGAFPTNVAAIDLAYDINDTIEEFAVEFQVQYWEAITTT
jgi:hypothetical protein|tara:strand:+ start:2153 stop:2686 length:534 start_codon:yes stop_codon:yes gene_type:complete